MDSERNLEEKVAKQPWNWLKVFGEARTRILLWYLALMIFFIAVALPTIRQRLFTRVQARVEVDIVGEVTEFQQLLAKGIKDDEDDEEILQRLRRQGKKIPLSVPKNREELATLFDFYLLQRIPKGDTFLITLLDGKFHKASPRALPKVINRDSALVQYWAKLTQPLRGELEIPDPEVGSVLYITQPVQFNNETLGVLVVAHITGGERNEALEALQMIVEVKVVVLAVALLLAWLAAGRLLAPLRLLRVTAQSISGSDLTKRLCVHGGGEIAELAATFNAMMNRLEAAFATQRHFVNDAGHELRTPITIIRGHLELMGTDPDEQQETLGLVMHELDRMSQFVDDLILLAKAERSDFLLLETIDIGELTEELFAKMTALTPGNWQLDAVAKGRMVADRQRVTQAMMNLAQNATQHTDKNDTIYIGSVVSKGKVSFWVRDTGEGIALADQQQIFERFARAAASRRRSEGAGLGLSIVRAIALAHGGQVNLKSKLGQGSTFTIVLPLEPPQ
ncbi:MAG: HAMP domain-containing histidine kinase [Scytonema sp. RU_4_4]|nr:HAMP domain-containing histidine kinase [Scytonema sp. RU_4_4]NJR73912.1 HAMP domain-containing histidine kinase [Scytonema sp. CRU_2_7]